MLYWLTVELQFSKTSLSSNGHGVEHIPVGHELVHMASVAWSSLLRNEVAHHWFDLDIRAAWAVSHVPPVVGQKCSIKNVK